MLLRSFNNIAAGSITLALSFISQIPTASADDETILIETETGGSCPWLHDHTSLAILVSSLAVSISVLMTTSINLLTMKWIKSTVKKNERRKPEFEKAVEKTANDLEMAFEATMQVIAAQEVVSRVMSEYERKAGEEAAIDLEAEVQARKMELLAEKDDEKKKKDEDV